MRKAVSGGQRQRARVAGAGKCGGQRGGGKSGGLRQRARAADKSGEQRTPARAVSAGRRAKA
ncbi:MAG TPA: hypothetical protein VL832_20200 [Puia sp.]|nr:hypothetical protein [Puia sp.]